MTFKLFMKRYWRIPLVAVLAALLAFGASFAVKASYTATSRLLIVEGSSPLVNSSGQSTQPITGTDDASSAQTLSETQAGLASSRAVATMVVDKLHLDAAKPASHGPIHALEGALATTYAHVKAWITAGFYKTPGRREKAIQTTEKAITATDLAPAGGSQEGQTDSYVLELDASGDTAVQAARIANAAADALVVVSKQQFERDSKFYSKSLATQLKDANSVLAADNQAVNTYETKNNISQQDRQLIQNEQNSGTVLAQLDSAQATLQGDKQTVSSLQATLAGTDPTETSNQSITTGRSTTADDTTQANPVYQTVQGQLSQAEANLASETATVSSLQAQSQANPSDTLTSVQAGLLNLEQKVTADQNSIQSLSSSLGQAQASVETTPISLSRLGTADVPTYPSSPKRYLFLLLGLLLGALAGVWLTYLARRRHAPDDDGRDDGYMTQTAEFDYRQVDRRQPVLVGSGVAGNGYNRRVGDNGHSPRNGSNGHHGYNRRAGDVARDQAGQPGEQADQPGEQVGTVGNDQGSDVGPPDAPKESSPR